MYLYECSMKVSWCIKPPVDLWLFVCQAKHKSFFYGTPAWVVLVSWSIGIIYHWKRTALGLYLFRVTWVVCQTSIIHWVNDTPLASIAKDTDGPTVRSDGQRNKYDLGKYIYWCLYGHLCDDELWFVWDMQ